MALSRMARRYLALRDAADAKKNKPLTRKVLRQWLTPIRSAFRELSTGEVTEVDGHPVTTIAWAGNEEARIDECINGFVSMLARVDSTFDSSAMTIVSNKLTAGEYLTHAEIEDCFKCLTACEDMLLKYPRHEIFSASLTEQVAIAFEIEGIVG